MEWFAYFKILIGIGVLASSVSWATEPTTQEGSPTESVIATEPSEPTPPADPSENEKLPQIEAKAFPVKVIKRSSSNRVYLFEDSDDHQPKTGHLMLLKREDNPVMAFRILKVYPVEKHIAAKRIKRYQGLRILDNDENYSAIEKISDIVSIPSVQDNTDLKELESPKVKGETKSDTKSEKDKVKAFDPELDGSTSPHGDLKEEAPIEPEEGEVDTHLAVTVEEVTLIEHTSHWVSAGFGFATNNGPPAKPGPSSFTAGNLRYGYNIAKLIFFDRAHLQDSFTLEGGFYLYKIINYEIPSDAYTVLALLGTLRYNLFFSESFGAFLYTGIMQNNVISSAQSQSDGLAQLNSILPAVGGGILFQVGPSWYTRVDIGLESITVNLSLRF